MYIPRRLFVIKPWLRARFRGESRVSLAELLAFLAQPGRAARASRWVRRIDEEDEYLIIHFHGLAHPLYWRRAEDLRALWMLVNEQFDASDWHHYEVPETRVEPDDVVVDCGACEGLFSLQVAGRCRKLYVVEPHQDFLAALRRTLAPFDHVEYLPYALADYDGEAHLLIRGELTRLDPHKGIPVPVRRLDTLFTEATPPITYLKADVENLELPVLQGASELIRRHRPKLAIAVYHPGNDYLEMIDYLRQLNPSYRFRAKGITASGKPVMLHAW